MLMSGVEMPFVRCRSGRHLERRPNCDADNPTSDANSARRTGCPMLSSMNSVTWSQLPRRQAETPVQRLGRAQLSKPSDDCCDHTVIGIKQTLACAVRSCSAIELMPAACRLKTSDGVQTAT